MPREDRFKKYQEAGSDFLETARSRAEEFLRELAKVSDTTQKQAQEALDDLIEGSRKGTELLVTTIRREVANQLALLGDFGKAGVPNAAEEDAASGAGEQEQQGSGFFQDQRIDQGQQPDDRCRGEEGPGQEDAGEEGSCDEGSCEEGSGEEGRRGQEDNERILTTRRRLDTELVRRQLAASRAQAADLIEARQVLVSGSVAERGSRMVGADEPVTLIGPRPRFVSRGGEKLDVALERFGVEVRDRSVLDSGASTGGFTDCLLQRGAAHVTAIDVGRGQLHERLRADGRVTVRERTDIRSVAEPDDPYDVVVADLSFISLRTVAPSLVGLAAPNGDLVVLVKPQFEVGRASASKGRGVIRDPNLWRDALEAAVVALEAAGATMMGVMVSPLRGADGNVEFLVHLRKEPEATMASASSRLRAQIDAAVADAVSRDV